MINFQESNTNPVWKIAKEDKDDWMKKHGRNTTLVKKFRKFEQSVTTDPYLTNRKVKKLQGTYSDVYEYKNRPVRALYQLDKPKTEIRLIDFDVKGNISYR